jgi:hypothetical protein
MSMSFPVRVTDDDGQPLEGENQGEYAVSDGATLSFSV